MSLYLMPVPLFKIIDANGDPVPGGKVYFYEPGTSTAKDTYDAEDGLTPNANPVILDANGDAEIWGSGKYKMNVLTAADVQVPGYPIDNVSFSPASTHTDDQWIASGLTPTYIDATSFSVPGDETTTYQVGRRLAIVVSAGTIYGTITASAYTTLTTITLSLDSGSVDSGISSFSHGILSITNPSLPATQIQSGELLYMAEAGAADVYTVDFVPAVTAYTTGMEIHTKISAANLTTTPTLNVNGLGAKTIVRQDEDGTVAVVPGDLPINYHGVFRYDGTDMVLLNPYTGVVTYTRITNAESPYTVLGTDEFIIINATDGAVTLNLPANSGLAGKQYIIKKSDSSTNTVTITPDGSEAIDNLNTLVLHDTHDFVQIMSHGNQWKIIARGDGQFLPRRKGADLASATTLNLVDDGDYFDVTGTTTIAGIASEKIGTVIRLHFDASLTLTHHATDFVLPAGVDIITAAGDEATFVSYASADWRCVDYQRYNGSPVHSPAFGAYSTAPQSNVTGSSEDVVWDAEEFDVGPCFGTDGGGSNSAANRFAPAVAGKYFLKFSIYVTGIVANDAIVLSLFKNGAAVKKDYHGFDVGSGDTSSQFTFSATIEMNGTTDYVTAVFENAARDTSDIQNDQTRTFFCGFKVSD